MKSRITGKNSPFFGSYCSINYPKNILQFSNLHKNSYLNFTLICLGTKQFKGPFKSRVIPYWIKKFLLIED